MFDACKTRMIGRHEASRGLFAIAELIILGTIVGHSGITEKLYNIPCF